MQGFPHAVHDLVTRIVRVTRVAFNKVFNTGQNVGESVQRCPVTPFSRVNQPLNKRSTGGQRFCHIGQRQHPQRAGDGVQQARYITQFINVPLIANVGNDGVLDLFQHVARFAQHGFLGVGQGTGFTTGFQVAFANHAGQRGFNKQQGTGNIKQTRLVCVATVLHRLNHGQLFLYRTAWRAKAQHAHGIGHLFHGRCYLIEGIAAVVAVAHGQIEPILDGGNFFCQCTQNLTNGVAIRARQRIPFFLDFVVGRQGVGQMVKLLGLFDGLAFNGGAGNVEQQVFDQIVRGRVVKNPGAILNQFFLHGIQFAQQQLGAGRDTGLCLQPFGECHGRQPDNPVWRVTKGIVQAAEYLQQVLHRHIGLFVLQQLR